MVTVEVDGSQFALAASRYVLEIGASMPKVLRAQTRLLLRDILRFTPPKSLAQGRKAVKGDFGRAIALLDEKAFSKCPERLRIALRAAISQKNITKINAILTSAKMRGTVIPFDASIHRRLQTNRGRVSKWSGFYTIDKQAWTARLNKLLSAVGFARAGWNAAAQKVGYKQPAWVSRLGNANGSNAIEIAGDIPSIEITHRSSKIPNYARSVGDAVRLRVSSMTKDIKRILATGGNYQDSTKLDIFD